MTDIFNFLSKSSFLFIVFLFDFMHSGFAYIAPGSTSIGMSVMLNRSLIINQLNEGAHNIYSDYSTAVNLTFTKRSHRVENVFYSVGLRYWTSSLYFRPNNISVVSEYDFHRELKYQYIAVPLHLGKAFEFDNDSRIDIYGGLALGIKELSTSNVNTSNSSGKGNQQINLHYDKSSQGLKFYTGLECGIIWFPIQKIPTLSVHLHTTIDILPSGQVKGEYTVVNNNTSYEEQINEKLTIDHLMLGLGYRLSFKQKKGAIRNRTDVPFWK